jgi:transposase
VVIVIGVDAHSQTHTAAAVDRVTGQRLAVLEVRARAVGHERLLVWGRELGDGRVWAIEDCRNLSGGLERMLLAAGERVLRVPPKMAASRKSVRSFGKSDAIDALAVARAVLREPDLPRARMAGPEREIALLVDFRAEMVVESTRLQSRLRWLLHDIDPVLEPAARGLANDGVLVRVGRRLALREQTAEVRISRELVRRLRDLCRQIKQIARELRPLVQAHGPALLAIPGCGVITAARLLAEIAGVERFQTDAQLALYAGVAPLEASSGKRRRYRLNRRGNRRLNSALYVIALTQARIHPPAREYLARRRQEGKSTAEAIRALKRHRIRHIFRVLTAAARLATTAPPA